MTKQGKKVEETKRERVESPPPPSRPYFLPFFPCPLFFCYCILFVFCLVSTNQHVLSRIHRSILRSHYVMQTDNIAFLFTEYKIRNSQKIRETIEVLCNPLFLLNHTF